VTERESERENDRERESERESDREREREREKCSFEIHIEGHNISTSMYLCGDILPLLFYIVDIFVT